jgi:hypothetical protein
MSHRPTTLERAFELARSGACPGLQDIRQRLKSEGYDPHQIEGPMLVRQLRELCDASRPAQGD